MYSAALCPQDIEVGFVVAEQLQVVEGLAAQQEVVSQVEDVVGFKVRDVPLEEMHPAVEGVGQTQLLHQQLQGPQASAAQPLGLVGDLEMDVLVPEHGLALDVPLALAEPPLDAALAIAEPLLYLGFHLKYLRAGERTNRVTGPFPWKRRGISSLFRSDFLRARGKRLFRG